jgi:hypothetical protein
MEAPCSDPDSMRNLLVVIHLGRKTARVNVDDLLYLISVNQ